MKRKLRQGYIKRRGERIPKGDEHGDEGKGKGKGREDTERGCDRRGVGRGEEGHSSRAVRYGRAGKEGGRRMEGKARREVMEERSEQGKGNV